MNETAAVAEFPSKQCAHCGKTFTQYKTDTANFKRQRFCSKKCNNDGRNIKKFTGAKVSTGTKGALAELIVCADLMRRGYQIFRSMSPHSWVDIIAYHQERRTPLCIEVRTGQMAPSGKIFFPLKINGADKGKENFAVVVWDGIEHTIHYFPELPE